MTEKKAKSNKYSVRIHREAKGVVVGDHATVSNVFQISHPPLGIPFQVPPLPAHFVQRPEVSAPLKARLLDDEATPTGILVISAIHGLGGIGKSVLAAALSYDKEVQVRFPDGVLWVTLGQRPEPLSLLNDWIVNELHDYNYRPNTIKAGTSHLRTLLQDKAALLVVDDVWDPEHTKPFLAGGPRCQILITTRRADVAEEVGAGLFELDVMTPEQSMALLAGRLKRPLEKGERDEALALARTVGHLPLALELAASRVARGALWTDLRAALEEEVARLEVLEGPRRRRTQQARLEASLNLSLDALRTEDEMTWQAFVRLGVLPEDVTVAAPTAATLWDAPKADAVDLLELLWNDALLLPALPMWVDGQEWRGYRLHDLLHDIVRRLLTDDPPRGLGFTLPDAHAGLLERYRAHTQEDLWHTLPDDGYIHSHLTWHMEQAGLINAIHALLREETEEGKNGWYTACDHLGQPSMYLASLLRAWQLADDAMIDPEKRAAALPQQILYALCLASFTSLSANYPPELLSLAIRSTLMTPAQALTHVRQMPDERIKAEALAVVAAHLPEALMAEALNIAQSLPNWIPNRMCWPRADALIGLARHLPLSLLTMALDANRTIIDYHRKEVLCALVSRLSVMHSPDLIALAWDVAMSIGALDDRAKVLSSLAPYLPDPLLAKALNTAEGLTERDSSSDLKKIRVDLLCALAPYLPEPLLSQALDSARAVGEAYSRARALSALIPFLAESLKVQASLEALDAAKSIEDAAEFAWTLESLAPLLPESFLVQALDVARGCRDAQRRSQALSRLASHLPEQFKIQALAEALDASRAVENTDTRVRLLNDLVSLLPEPMLAEVLEDFKAIGDAHTRAHALNDLIPFLAEPLKTQALTEAVDAAKAMQGERWRAFDLKNLVSHLPQSLKAQAMDDAQLLPSHDLQSSPRASVLVRLATHLPEPLKTQAFTQALDAAKTIYYTFPRAKALTALTPHLPEQLKMEAFAAALDTVRSLESLNARANLLSSIFPDLPPTHKTQASVETLLDAVRIIGDADDLAFVLSHLACILREPIQALDIIRMVRREDKRAAILVFLAPYLAESCLPQALDFARMILDKKARADALISLSPYVSRLYGIEVMIESVDAAQAIEDKWQRIFAMVNLVPHLPESLRKEVLAEILNTISSMEEADANVLSGIVISFIPIRHDNRPLTLEYLAPHLPESLQGQALDTARTIRHDGRRAEAMSGLVPYLPELLKMQILDEALKAALTIENTTDRIEALSHVAPHLAEPLRTQILAKALDAAKAVKTKSGYGKAHYLLVLAPHLPEPLLPKALDIARSLWNSDRTEALVGLAAYLPETRQTQIILEEALDAAREHGKGRVKALISLAPHLAEPQKTQVCVEALDAVRHLSETSLLYVGSGPRLLVTLASHLPQPMLAHALDIATTLRDSEYEAQPRAYALKGLAPHLYAWARAQPDLAVSSWNATLRTLADHPRLRLLDDLHELLPFWISLVPEVQSQAVTKEISWAIQAVGRWWP